MPSYVPANSKPAIEPGFDRYAADPYLLKEIASLVIGAAATYFGMRAMLHMLDPRREEKDKAKGAKKTLLDRLGLLEADVGELDEHESALCDDVLTPGEVNVGFDDIGGLEDIKRSIIELIIFPLKHPHLFRGALLSPPKGILLYGPPGTGKTMLAKAIAKQSGARFINLSQSSLQNKWFGESVKLIRAVFRLATKLQPAILFIDEIDSFLRERSSGDHQAHADMKCEFMTLWDGIGTDPNAAVIVLGASNRPWDIDDAIQRRLSRSFKVDLPSPIQRAKILSVVLSGDPAASGLCAQDIQTIAERTDRFSGSDLHEMCRAAAFGPVRELVSEQLDGSQPELEPLQQLRKLTLRDFEAVLDDTPTTQQAAKQYLNSKDLEKASSTGTATANQVAVPIVNNFFVGGQPWRPSDTPVD